MARKKLGCFPALIIIIVALALYSHFATSPSSPPSTTSKKQTLKTEIKKQKNKSTAKYNWKTVASNLMKDYQGKIISIEQLNSSTCWAVLSPSLTTADALKTAENIGYYIRNSTGGLKGATPSVHVFLGGKHVALARPSGKKYHAKLDIQNWETSDFGGQYRP